jgi:hypothetical protein
MIHQIEITTCCNFKCFYCVGRTMPQKHMEEDAFAHILSGISAGSIVNLQGEGESALHPAFWKFVDVVVKHGCYPFTITNGTLISKSTVKDILRYFPHIGVSLDSLDDTADIGRYNQKIVLSKIESLFRIAGNMYVEVYITDYGQDIGPLTRYLERKGIKYIVQSLQTKPDYIHSSLYLSHVRSVLPEVKKNGVICRYVLQGDMRFYNVDGLMFPCCFIKDSSKYISMDDLLDTYRQKLVPKCCFGCRELTINNSQPYYDSNDYPLPNKCKVEVVS